MKKLKPKEQHELLLANVDKEKIVQFLNDGQDQEVTRIAVALARQHTLFDHFQRLWLLRVSDLDEKLSSEGYMKRIYENKRSLHKELRDTDPPK